MQFVAFVEIDAEKMSELAATYIKLGTVEGLKTIADYGTPAGKGVHIFEAESENAIFKYFTPVLPLFKSMEVYPALPVEKVVTFAQL